MFAKIKDFILFPYTWYRRRKNRKILEKRLKELQEQDPYIYD